MMPFPLRLSSDTRCSNTDRPIQSFAATETGEIGLQGPSPRVSTHVSLRKQAARLAVSSRCKFIRRKKQSGSFDLPTPRPESRGSQAAFAPLRLLSLSDKMNKVDLKRKINKIKNNNNKKKHFSPLFNFISNSAMFSTLAPVVKIAHGDCLGLQPNT